jgi:shikimate 5-dehydrogenase
VPLRAADFDDFLTFADAMHVSGASVTIPFKLDALRAADTADCSRTQWGRQHVDRIGDRWEATNTDVHGFLDPLDPIYPVLWSGTRAVMGGGGCAVRCRRARRSAARASRCTRASGAGVEVAPVAARVRCVAATGGSWDMLCNCTPLGGPSARTESPLPEDRLRERWSTT